MEMLEGIKILDFAVNVAGPHVSAIATDYGASVIKIEARNGAPCRGYAPYIDGIGFSSCWVNRGKKSVTMDLKDPRAIEACKKLIKDADVLVESFRPGVMDRFGLGYEEMHKLNPKLVYCSVSAFGQTGPYAQKPGYDIMAQALSGMVSVTGPKGSAGYMHGVSIADFFAGVNGYAAMMTALFHAMRTGEGQHVDVSILGGMVYLNSPIDRLNTGTIVKANGNHHQAQSPFGIFEHKSGRQVVICAHTGAPWERIIKMIEHPEWNEIYPTVKDRGARQEEIIAVVTDWLNSFDNLDDAIAIMDECGVPNCRVNTVPDVINDPQVLHMGYVVQAPVPDNVNSIKTYTTRGPNAIFSAHPGSIHKQAVLGADSREVFVELGYSKEEVESMVNDWAPTMKAIK